MRIFVSSGVLSTAAIVARVVLRCNAFQFSTTTRQSLIKQELQQYNHLNHHHHLLIAKTRSIQLHLAGNNRKNLSAAERERRDEEDRRRARKDEVVPGKTSAKPGEKDYTLDPKATEMEWLRQASNLEQEVYAYTDKGMELLKLVRIGGIILLAMRNTDFFMCDSYAPFFLSQFRHGISCKWRRHRKFLIMSSI